MMDAARNVGDLVLRRSLTPAQTDQLMVLFDAEWWTKGRIRPDVEAMLASGHPIFAFTEPKNHDLVAFARVVTDGVYKAMIFDIIVSPSWRSTGLGRLLVETVLNDAAIARVKHRELYCANDMAHFYCANDMAHFYEKWGFRSDLDGLTFMRLA